MFDPHVCFSLVVSDPMYVTYMGSKNITREKVYLSLRLFIEIVAYHRNRDRNY